MQPTSSDSNREKIKDTLKNARRYSFELIAGCLLGITLLIVTLIFFRFMYYKNLGLRKVSQVSTASQNETLVTELPPAAANGSNDKLPVRYQLQQGDTLWKIAAIVYGDGNKYTVIEQANHLKSDAILAVGQVILIPKIEGSTFPSKFETENQPQQPSAPAKSGQQSYKPQSTPGHRLMKTVKNSASPVKHVKVKQTKVTRASTYVVQKGDSLWKISGKKYGKGQHWPVIYKANKVKIGPNPNLIYPKTKLNIPKLTTVSAKHRVK